MADREPDESGTDADLEEPPDSTDPETLREAVEEKYDFETFGPADMAEMTVEEWEAAFDPESWITGERLLDRIEAELRSRVAAGELFAVVERHRVYGEPRLLVYTDTDYTLVYPDGTIEGDGGIRRAVEPVIALCSMADFEVSEPPADAELPDPASIKPGSGDLGHRLLLAVAVIQLAAGLVLLVSPLAIRLGPGAGALTTVIGLVFILVGIVLGVLVANARLSDRFRAAEYRDRLEAAGVGSQERPGFLPPLEEADPEAEGSDAETG